MTKLVPWSCGLLALALSCGPVEAAGLDAAYQWLGGKDGNEWQVTFTLHADGTPANLSEFTVWFPETSFGTLTLQAAPGTWDTLVAQPDPQAGPGFLDGLVSSPATGLTAGQSQTGWVVSFNYLGAGQPGALNFDIVDPTDHVTSLASGQTAVVPEPASYALMLAGALALGLWCARRRTGGAA